MNPVIPIVLAVTSIAVLFDLKKERIIPNYLSYFLIIFGIGSHTIISILQNSYLPILLSIAGAVLLFAFGYLLYLTGIWGGGDAKLIAGFGAALAGFSAVSAWPFLLTVLFNILICGVALGTAWSAYLAYKNRKEFVSEVRKILDRFKIVVAGFYLSLVLVIIAVMFQIITAPLIWGSAVVLFYFTVSMKAVENSCMYKFAKADELIEGDWIAEPVKFRGRIVYAPSRIGISQKDIDRLKKLGARNIKVKEGLPYIPAFLAALVFSLLGVDIMFVIFSMLLQ